MEKRKFAVLTDSTCDIPKGMEAEYGIDILNFKIALDGEAYVERVDFTPEQYSEMLRNAKGIPTTSQITAYEFLEKFLEYDDQGIEQVLYVSINATASATNACAHKAAEDFAAERPQSAMRIHVVDSHCYSFAYGVQVIEAAKRLDAGESMEAVIEYLEDMFARVEIVLTAYTLKVIRKSGRVSAAAAIAGDLLGIHPIFTLNDGVSEVVKKVRGDKAVCSNVCRLVKSRMAQGNKPYYVAVSNRKYEKEYADALESALGYPPALTLDLGSAVVSNTGPDAVGIIFEGAQKRER